MLKEGWLISVSHPSFRSSSVCLLFHAEPVHCSSEKASLVE